MKVAVSFYENAMGWTRACCQNLGTWLVCSDLVKRRGSAGAISSATISRRRQGMLSGLDAFVGGVFLEV